MHLKGWKTERERASEQEWETERNYVNNSTILYGWNGSMCALSCQWEGCGVAWVLEYVELLVAKLSLILFFISFFFLHPDLADSFFVSPLWILFQSSWYMCDELWIFCMNCEIILLLTLSVRQERGKESDGRLQVPALSYLGRSVLGGFNVFKYFVRKKLYIWQRKNSLPQICSNIKLPHGL